MKRARLTFWVLAAAATAAIGGLSRALAASPSPGTGLAVAASATVLVLSLVLAGRILMRLNPHSR